MATQTRKSARTPFYASVGVTDLAVETVREAVTDVQTRVRDYRTDVSKSVSSIDLQPKALRDQAVTVVSSRVSALGDAYGDLVKRGESLVGRIRRQQSTQQTVASAETTVAKAKTTRTQATKATTATKKTAKKATKTATKSATRTAKKQSGPSRSSAKATVTSAKKTASSATKAVTDAAQKVGD